MVLGHKILHRWWQKQRLIDLPGAECLAHAAGENLTRASLASKIRYYSDRLLALPLTAASSSRPQKCRMSKGVGLPHPRAERIDGLSVQRSNHRLQNRTTPAHYRSSQRRSPCANAWSSSRLPKSSPNSRSRVVLLFFNSDPAVTLGQSGIPS